MDWGPWDLGTGVLTPASLPGGVLGAAATDAGDRILLGEDRTDLL